MADDLPLRGIFGAPHDQDVQPAEPEQQDALARARSLSEQFITHFYHRDERWCLSRCTPDVSYLGSTQHGIALDLEGMHHVMSVTLASFNPSLVLAVETDASEVAGGEAVLVIARFLLISDPSTGHVRASRRRGTLLWVREGDALRLRHMHFTTPSYIGTIGDGSEGTPSRETYLYAKALLEQVIRRDSIVLRDVAGVMHQVAPIEVRTVEASRQKAVVHCLDRDVTVRMGIGKVAALLGESLIMVHRSFAVNPAYVRTVSRGAVEMDDGTRIPLPRRRSREVRLRLEEALRMQESGNRLIERQSTPYGESLDVVGELAFDSSFLLP